jgi:hypothetical protein
LEYGRNWPLLPRFTGPYYCSIPYFDGFEPEGVAARKEFQEPGPTDDVEVHECEDGVGAAPILTNREAVKALDSLKEYAIAKSLPAMLKHLTLAENCHQDYLISAKKQTLITDFFAKK